MQGHLTDDQICDVLTSPNYTIANKTILNCLIEKVKCTANIVEFSDQLEKVATLLSNSETLLSVVMELRAGKLILVGDSACNRKRLTDKLYSLQSSQAWLLYQWGNLQGRLNFTKYILKYENLNIGGNRLFY